MRVEAGIAFSINSGEGENEMGLQNNLDIGVDKADDQRLALMLLYKTVSEHSSSCSCAKLHFQHNVIFVIISYLILYVSSSSPLPPQHTLAIGDSSMSFAPRAIPVPYFKLSPTAIPVWFRPRCPCPCLS
jgi:hypothetical protein